MHLENGKLVLGGCCNEIDGPAWQCVDRDIDILGEDRIIMMGKTKIVNCTFRYKCPMKWEQLAKTNDDVVRFCHKCSKNVYYCETDKELQLAMDKGRCVAVIVDTASEEIHLGVGDASFRLFE